MTILVTGGAGYIGSHTCVELLNKGYDVVVIDNLVNSSAKAIERVEEITGKKVAFYENDVRDRAALDRIFEKHDINCTIHFAGLKAVGESVAMPLEYYDNNLFSTVRLCEAMRDHGVKNIVFSSSATVYSGDNEVPLKETSKTGNCTSPYGWTKYMSEQILRDTAKAVDDFSAAIEEDGRYAFLYYARGWTRRLMGDKEKALADYDLGIDIDTTYAYIYLERGLTLKMLGRHEEARKDFEHVVAMDTVATDGSCTHYALLELGREKEAAEWMQKIIDENPRDFGNVYDQSCLYVRRGLYDKALDKLQEAFRLGYRNFPHLEFDMDMDPVRDTPRYKALGNSIALPPWKWVLKRISAQYERDATLGSLFDGIGGFPFLWEQINGKGSALWASEIEEFPIAVTRYRFGGG